MFRKPSALCIVCFMAAMCTFLVSSPARAQETSAGPLMTLLKSGRLPDERLGTVIELVCKRGNADELRYLLDQCLASDGFSNSVRRQTLAFLVDAAQTRKIRPSGDLAVLEKLIDPEHPEHETAAQVSAVRLAGLWQVTSLAKPLARLAGNNQAPAKLRQAAIDGLVDLRGHVAHNALRQLSGTEQPQEVRYQAVAALTAFDLEQAAQVLATVLAQGTAQDDPSAALDAFFDRQQGAEKLAAALNGARIPVDVAKRALRHMYAVGRSDAALSAVLSRHAGISETVTLPTKAEMDALAEAALKHGDPARGEEVFRSPAVSCMKCHSVSKAGGVVGPDLSALGASSPVDYIVASILNPSQAIKEEFKTRIVLTLDGKVLTGIVVDRDETRLVLRDAQGQQRVIPTADIDDEQDGGSLMPAGLTRFLTRQELVDLVRFLSQLGKPGPYGIRTSPTVQRYRMLREVPDDLAAMVPDEELIERKILEAPADAWLPAYARVGGALPLAELVEQTRADVLYVSGEVDLSRPGAVGLTLDAWDGVHAWIDNQPISADNTEGVELAEGRHRLTLRIDTAARKEPTVRATFVKPHASQAEFTVVDGP